MKISKQIMLSALCLIMNNSVQSEKTTTLQPRKKFAKPTTAEQKLQEELLQDQLIKKELEPLTKRIASLDPSPADMMIAHEVDKINKELANLKNHLSNAHSANLATLTKNDLSSDLSHTF